MTTNDANDKSPLPLAPRGAGRRSFLSWCGCGLGAAAIGGIAARVLVARPRNEPGGGADPEPAARFAWQIDPAKCTYCGKCATACVRKPSAVRAVNDQKVCSNCVVCYGHIFNRQAKSDEIDAQGKVCPLDAVNRAPFPPDSKNLDGLFLYTIQENVCDGCGACVRECNVHGNKSMFLVIRPDLCLGCHECTIAQACPSDAVEFLPMQPVTDYRPDLPHQF